jgi:F-box and WD-40 domain protein 1/11
LVVSGSSDKHLRLFDITTSQGWSTSPDFDTAQSAGVPFFNPVPGSGSPAICQSCGNAMGETTDSVRGTVDVARCIHGDLVRTVALGEEFVLSGSYDLSIKVWERKTGKIVADLTGGHTGRIFCIGFDATKIVSCGEDHRICIWDFSHGINTSFLKL